MAIIKVKGKEVNQEEFNKKTAEEVLSFASEKLGRKVALASSFGAEDVVLIDMISKAAPGIIIFTLDTGRLHEETYKIMEKIREKYGVEIKSYFPKKEDVEKLEREKGFYSFYKSIEDRKECCGIRKVEPLKRALSELDAWITGLRREQVVTRTSVNKIEIDEANDGVVKFNPLADWTQKQVWDYIKKNKVPYNELHDKNFPSIGCSPCTRAVKKGEDFRAGRWWWESADKRECGLHISDEELLKED
jgi:phosphoadenosine phosphosulfate reductase|tara:strand:+ start:62 stop:802 length:741 start_codon:yes stop_codon:yes gene_type:complete